MSETLKELSKWTIFVDGLLNIKGRRDITFLKSENGFAIRVMMKIDFSTSSNLQEYDTCLDVLQMALEIGARDVVIKYVPNL